MNQGRWLATLRGMSTRILVTADIHIGRRPARVESGIAERCSCARAWLDLVRYAVAEGVSALLLAGDIVDEGNKFFEALGPFENGLRQLGAAGIPVLAVSGNHDFDVLSHYSELLGAHLFRVLGRGGHWESVVISAAAGVRFQVVGWSFPQGRVHESPLCGLGASGLKLESGLPTLGLLHADLDASGGYYAPVSRHELSASGIPFWVLGHIHKPAYYAGGSGVSGILYPGSLQGLDPGPGETGLHGPWLLEIDQGQVATVTQVPLAGLVYDNLRLDVEACQDINDVRRALAAGIQAHVEARVAEHPGLVMLYPRLHVTGRTGVDGATVRQALREAAESLMEVGAVQVPLAEWEVQVRPRLDLAVLAHEKSLVGELARLVQVLEEDLQGESWAEREFLKQVSEQVRNVRTANIFSQVGRVGAMPSQEECGKLALSQAWQLLDVLCHQRDDERGG